MFYAFLPHRSEPEVKEVKKESSAASAPKVDLRKEAAIQAELQAAQRRATVPIEERIKQFKELLAEKDVSIDTLFVYVLCVFQFVQCK